ncbi:MAG: TonB-dependent receptor [Deltaproteobacteria bacterium]|nr:TonB-dependent receptor [Deltaproteobacteria bacterium]
MRKLILVLALLVGLSTVARAQTEAQAELDETNSFGTELDMVVVSASRIPESLREVSQHVQVITAADIERSSSDEIVDFLKKLGIRTFMEGSDTYGNNGIAMRGGRTSMHGFDLGGDILILVDGRRSATDFGSEFNLGNVERIEVLHGPGAVQYGSSAISGVINIITKRGDETPRGHLEAGIGSWSESKLSASGSGMVGNFDLSGGISWRSRGNFSHPDGTVEDNSDLPSRINYNANVGYNFNDRHRLGLVVQGSTTDDAGKGTAEGSTSSTSGYRHTRQDRSSYAVDLLYEGGNESQSMGWLVRYFVGETDYKLSRFYTPRAIYGRKYFSNSRNEYNGAQGQFGWKLGDLQLVTGLDWLKYDYEQVQLVTNRTESYSVIENLGTFLLAKYHPFSSDQLVLSAGLRYDEFDVNVQSHTHAGSGYNRHIKTSLSKVNPSFGITYNPFDFLKLRASYGASYKLPLPRQLGGYTYMMSTPFVGNPDLKPEESKSLEVGFDLEYRGLFLTGTFFDTKFENLITYRTVTPRTPGYITGITPANYYWYYNVDKATVRGIDFGASFDLGEFFDLDFRLEPYIYWTRLFRFSDDQTRTPLNDRGRDTTSFGLEFSYPSYKLSASLDGVRYGNMQSGTASTNDRINDSVVWNFSLRKSIFTTDHFGDVYLKAAIKNLFNEEYQTTLDDVMPGRSFYLGLEYNY